MTLWSVSVLRWHLGTLQSYLSKSLLHTIQTLPHVMCGNTNSNHLSLLQPLESRDMKIALW